SGLAWPLPEDLDEAALEGMLYPGNAGLSRRRAEPDWEQVHLVDSVDQTMPVTGRTAGRLSS
ncbi:MAG: hypothetical protein ACM3RP_05500, partial [Chitinophagales bacterium]